VRQGGNIPPIWARASGAATRLVGITWTDEFQAVITRPGGPTGAADLRGARVGIPRRPNDLIDFHRATALKGLWSALRTAGLVLDDVVQVDLPIAESVIQTAGEPSLHGLRRRQPYLRELQALTSGEVDAVFVKGAEGVLAANLLGAQVVASIGDHPDPVVRINNGTPRLFTVDAALARERPDLVRLLISQVQRAGDWAAAHPDETLRYVAREIGASEEAVAASNGPRLHHHLGLSLAPELLHAVEVFQQLLLRWGFLPAGFPVADWVDASAWPHTRDSLQVTA
jgi:ABC-type nitrate/sulfonate/bicarbonate transport system substrate-binding protein